MVVGVLVVDVLVIGVAGQSGVAGWKVSDQNAPEGAAVVHAFCQGAAKSAVCARGPAALHDSRALPADSTRAGSPKIIAYGAYGASAQPSPSPAMARSSNPPPARRRSSPPCPHRARSPTAPCPAAAPS